MHNDELWQEYGFNGAPLENGGRSPEKGNLKPEERDARRAVTGNATIWFYRHGENGTEVLFQKRSKYVDRFPEKWDISAGGHINYQETPLEAAIRESKEEIGADITAEDLRFCGSVFTGCRLTHYFFCDWTGKKDNFHFDDAEVAEVKWVPLASADEFRKKYAKEPLANEDEYIIEMLKHWLIEYD